jgi:hypothetical protein
MKLENEAVEVVPREGNSWTLRQQCRRSADGEWWGPDSDTSVPRIDCFPNAVRLSARLPGF